jgi:hypothetical protein
MIFSMDSQLSRGERCSTATMEPTIVSAIRVGCSGWVYKHWRGSFYAEGHAIADARALKAAIAAIACPP